MSRNDMLFWMALGSFAINTFRADWIGALCSLAGLAVAYYFAPSV